MKTSSIPEDVKHRVKAQIDRFNKKTFPRGDCYYEARFRSKFLYLYRCDYGTIGPICRLTYTGDMDNWDFAIFKWSSETYDPDEWLFPGAGHVDGTIKGAMKAGLEAYPV